MALFATHALPLPRAEARPTTRSVRVGLNLLARSLSRRALLPTARRDVHTAAEQALATCLRQVAATILEVEAFNLAPVVGDACRVARLGVYEAASALEQWRALAGGDDYLRLARRKLYLALMTIRHTLRRVETHSTPLWRTLAPALAARNALASFRDMLAPATSGVELEWRLAVAQGELGLLLADPSLTMLGHHLQGALCHFAEDLRDAGAADAELERVRLVVDDALAEANERPELRAIDERVLRELMAELTRGRGDENSLRVKTERLLRVVWGLDAELDRVIAEVESEPLLPWSLVLVTAGEVQAARFDTTWVSGSPPHPRR